MRLLRATSTEYEGVYTFSVIRWQLDKEALDVLVI